jgi:hypothetical protein
MTKTTLTAVQSRVLAGAAAGLTYLFAHARPYSPVDEAQVNEDRLAAICADVETLDGRQPLYDRACDYRARERGLTPQTAPRSRSSPRRTDRPDGCASGLARARCGAS